MLDSFIHLHNHFEGSINDSALRSKEAAAKAKELGMGSLAITDHGSMYWVINFYKDCEKQGIKPIIGMETYVAPRGNLAKEGRQDAANYHLVLLCENNEGYQNLMKIASDAALDGMYYNHRTDYKHLKQWHNGLIALSACLGGEVQEYLVAGKYDEAKETALIYDEIFGRGNFFLELQDHGIPEQKQINPLLVKISRETGIPLVATNDCHYLTQNSFEAHDVLMAIQAKTTVDDDKRKKYPCDQFYLKTQEEMWKIFAHVPEALENTVKIAERCNVKIEFGVNKMPPFPVPTPYTSEGYLMEKLLVGIDERYGGMTPELQERLDYEFETVKNMGYLDYFLIVWDLFRFARERNIFCGPGRGSGAGSMMLYALHVTHVEPIQYGLLFERFLDPSRVSMPDVDTDWPDDRRQEVIDYIIDKYGSESCCQIITFGTMKAKSAIGGVGRALGIEQRDYLSITKMMPNDPKLTLRKALDTIPSLKARYEEVDWVHHLIDIAMQVEGLPTSIGTHAAGMLVADRKGLREHVPLCRTDKGIVAQYAMGNLDDLGMLKLDLLGLNTLKIIVNTLRLVERNYGIIIDPYSLYACDDLKVLEVIRNGWTEGIFQLEGVGMTNFMKELGPSSIEEVTAGVALYRPGPMDMIPQYIEGKRNPETIHYDFPELEPIFKETYGVMTYQEQCMKSAIAVAGYQKHHSDSLRRGIAKKKKELLTEHRGLFIEGRDTGNPHDYIPGGVKTGHDRARLEEFFDKMEKFGDYCFNKSHAAAYAVLAYSTAWAKYYYPAEFMAANMDEKRKDQALLARYIKHCENDLGIEIAPPSINESQPTFNPVSEKKIIFSLAVKETKNDILVSIVGERDKNGPFTSMIDFLNRTWDLIDKDTIKALNFAGAFDVLQTKRSSMLAGIEDIMRAIQSFKGAAKRYQDNPKSRRKEPPELSEWISDIDSFLPQIQEFPDDILLRMEKEYIGIYVTGHPLNKFMCSITNFSNFSLADLTYDVDEETGAIMLGNNIHDGMKIQLVAQITEITKLATKKDKIPMASVTLEDLTGSVRAVIFPRAYAICSDILEEDQIYRIKGQIQADRDEAPSIIINEIILLKNDLHKRIVFHARKSSEESEAFLKYLSSLQCYGESPVYIQFNRMQILLKKKYWVDFEIFEQKCKSDIRAKCSISEW